MRCTLARDDIPLLSQWIKKFDKSKLVEFFGGGEGSRTPVRKTFLPTFYERICLFILVLFGVKQHTPKKTSPLMRDEIQGYFSYTFTAT